jgi:DNA-binding transcriptional MerR regulator
MASDLLTVKEAAELLGISKQAVYKRMEKDFQPYVVLVDRQKHLSYKVLQLISDNHSTKTVDSSAEVETLKKLVEILEKENELKQKTIEQLRQQNEEEHRQLMQLTGQVGSALQSFTQGQLADKLIEGRLMMDGEAEADPPPMGAGEKKKSWLWQMFKRKT